VAGVGNDDSAGRGDLQFPSELRAPGPLTVLNLQFSSASCYKDMQYDNDEDSSIPESGPGSEHHGWGAAGDLAAAKESADAWPMDRFSRAVAGSLS
jgi:hypothetical protein